MPSDGSGPLRGEAGVTPGPAGLQWEAVLPGEWGWAVVGMGGMGRDLAVMEPVVSGVASGSRPMAWWVLGPVEPPWAAQSMRMHNILYFYFLFIFLVPTFKPVVP